MAFLEEQALHIAALDYARAKFQPLEVRMRIDRAREVIALLQESNPLTDRPTFHREELDVALELARLTLMHAGERDYGLVPAPQRPPAVEALLVSVQKIIREAQLQLPQGAEASIRAVVLAFNQCVQLLSPCARLAGDPDCARDGDCPMHGKNRPGQCVPVGVSP